MSPTAFDCIPSTRTMPRHVNLQLIEAAYARSTGKRNHYNSSTWQGNSFMVVDLDMNNEYRTAGGQSMSEAASHGVLTYPDLDYANHLLK